MYNTRCRSKETASFAGEGGIDAPWWELRFPTGVVEITIMKILSPNVLQCTVSLRDERGYTQMRDTTMRVDNVSFITTSSTVVSLPWTGQQCQSVQRRTSVRVCLVSILWLRSRGHTARCSQLATDEIGQQSQSARHRVQYGKSAQQRTQSGVWLRGE